MPANYDMLDTIIAINIILFIVSVIVEKITQQVRKYAPFKFKWAKELNLWRNIGHKQTGKNPAIDKLVEREVNSLSFVIGMLIAFAFRIDLFKMLSSSDPRTVLLWNDAQYSPLEMVLFFISLPLTAFFLTFGSKFFHDILDTIMQVKNLKRKMVDSATYNTDTITQFDEYLQKSYKEIINTAIVHNASRLNVPSAIYPPFASKITRNGKIVDCIEIHLSGPNNGKLPDQVVVSLEGGKSVIVPVNIITDVELPVILGGKGDSIANAKTPNYKGTICCKVSRAGNTEYLTCNHVFTGGIPENNFGDIQQAPASLNGYPDAVFNYSLLTESLDISLFKADGYPFQYEINPLIAPRPVTVNDILATEVKVVCRNGYITKGNLINNCLSNPTPIKYDNGKTITMLNLITLSNYSNSNDINTYKTLTQKGDSGACVYDNNGSPIAMVIAGNNKFSYAIPMVDILEQLKATIIS